MSDKAVESMPRNTFTNATNSLAASNASSRLQIIDSLVPLAVGEVTRQMPDFISRLDAVLCQLSEQSVHPNEANFGFNALNHLRKNTALFQRAVVSILTSALLCEIAALHHPCDVQADWEQREPPPISPEEMENKVLIETVSQAIELRHSAALVGLNIRLSRLLRQVRISISENPFRPALFLRTVFDAWCKFDPQHGTHRIVLRLLRPEIFFDFAPLLAKLNQALIARGVVPDLAEAYRHNKTSVKVLIGPDAERRDASLQNKVYRWLQRAGVDDAYGKNSAKSPSISSDGSRPTPQHVTGQRTPLSPMLIAYLSDLQPAMLQLPMTTNMARIPSAASILRNIVHYAPAGALSTEQHNIIELLTKIVEFIFSDDSTPLFLKKLLMQLQLPLLKLVLVDQDFFYKEDHPARHFLDQLVQSAIGRKADTQANDPLYKIIAQLIGRVNRSHPTHLAHRTFAQQLPMFRDVLAELQLFLTDQERAAKTSLAQFIAKALDEEEMQHAEQSAAKDIAMRIETGAVAGFVEVFLETQWIRVMTMAHSVAEHKPKVRAHALRAMDELIWSLQPKLSAVERTELITRLPSMLSMINAWLNVIKWDGPERVTFFSNLVDRHAALVQGPVELSPRHQLHRAVNIAQKVSERRLNDRARELDVPPIDQYDHVVDNVELGQLVRFILPDGAAAPFRLMWISPLRNRFIFCNPQHREPYCLTADEFALALREQGASAMMVEAITTRALSAVLKTCDDGS